MTLSLIKRSFCISFIALAGGLSVSALNAAPSQPHTWRNVQIVGGGFIPGVVYSRATPGLVYVRTDIGGAYRLDTATGKWIPLTDSLGWDDWNLTGIVSIAADPQDANRVYLAAGTYTNSWATQNGAILRSADRGATWQRTMLPFKLGGNMPGRGAGERLVSTLTIATCCISARRVATACGAAPMRASLGRRSRVSPLSAAIPKASDEYLGDMQGVYWVTFDPRTGTPGSTTQTIYVGVAETLGPSIYRSTNGGATWSAVPGQPIGYLPHKGVLDTVNNYFFIATSDNGGPYGGALGQVWRLNLTTGVWTDISPMLLSEVYFGFSGLTIDQQNPGTIMVTGYSSWWPDTFIYRSTNSGTRGPMPGTGRVIRTDPSATRRTSRGAWLYWGGRRPPDVSPRCFRSLDG